jgi:hypothetical protein
MISSPLVQSHSLGLQTRDISSSVDDAENPRRICPDEDLYPPPLMDRYPSRKVTGIDRLLYAIMYLQVHRVRELLMEHLSTPETLEEVYNYRNYYQQNLLHEVCSVNHPTNLSYTNPHNRIKYDQIFGLFISLIPDLKRFEVPDGFDRNPLEDCICNQHLHYALVLINCGFTINPNDPKYSEKKHILSLENTSAPNYEELYTRKRNFVNNFLRTERARKVFESSLKPGTKLLTLTDGATCPLTTNKINEPAVLEDGQVYELTALRIYFLTNQPMSPISRKEILPVSVSITPFSFTHHIRMRTDLG